MRYGTIKFGCTGFRHQSCFHFARSRHRIRKFKVQYNKSKLINLTKLYCRTLLWVSVVALPLLGASWILSLLSASENHPLLTPFLSLAVLLHAAFSLGGYCFANNRIRQNLFRYLFIIIIF